MKIGKLQSYFFVLGLIPLFHSCSLTGGDKETIIQVEKEFSINMYEQLGTTRRLYFELESIEVDSCLNSSIDRAVIVNSKEVSLLLNGIEPASDCNPGVAPATSTVHAGYFSNGVYDFLVTTRNLFTDEGILTIDDEKYVIDMSSSEGISIVNSTLYRIPEQVIWGYYAYDDENLVGDAPKQFQTELESLVQVATLKKGYYGDFQIGSNNELVLLKATPSFNYSKTFFYKYTGSEAHLKELLKNYREGQAGNHMELVIFTSNGSVL